MHPKRLLRTSLLLLLAASPGRVVSSDPTPYLVKDLDPAILNLSSYPFPYVSLGNGRSVFLAEDRETGRELWGSDGTAAGTSRLLDACAGPCSLQYTFLGPVGEQPGRRAVFFTSDPANNVYFGSLWVTGGSRNGTFLLADGLEIDQETRPVWVPGMNLLFFVANDGVHGFELWRTDGTAAGTRMVRDLLPGSASPQPMELTAFKGRLYFVANHRERGPALWMSNGTPAGTRMVRDPWVGRSDHPAPAFLRAVGPALFFFAPSPDHGFELWRSDGTRAGTLPTVDLVPGPEGPQVAGATVAGERFYFVASAGQGQELWTSNGTLGGTRRLTDLPADDAFWLGQLQLPVTAPGGRAAFVADDGTHGLEPWLTNGTPAGTRLLDICPGACGSGPVLDRVHAGRLYLSADDGRRGREPWVSDGTVAGTRLLRDLCPGSCASNPDFLHPFGPRLLFTADRVGVPGTRLFRTDGTWNGTVRIAAFSEPLFALDQAGEVPGALLFTGWDPENGHELWRTDATAAGTRLVADLVGREPASSSPRHLAEVDGRLRFVARTHEGNESLLRFWESDGSAAGTVPRGGDLPLYCANELYLLTHLPGGDPLFICPESYPAQVLWRGAESGPVRLTPPGVWPTFVTPVAVLGSTVFFSAISSGFGFEVWKTDGTPEGTARVTDLQSGPGDATPHGFTVFQGRVWFTAWSDDVYGRAIWSTDGTAEGTALLLPPNMAQDQGILGVHGGRLWFSARADDGTSGFELWSTDGTAEGTHGFDLIPGLAGFNPLRLISAGTRMFFSGAEAGAGLWVSDGTEEGSRRIGPASLHFHAEEDAVLVSDRLFYRSLQDDTLWMSDGTEAGTRPVPGPDGQPIVGARDLTPFAGQLFFLWNGGIWRTGGSAAGSVRVQGDFQTPGEMEVVGNRIYYRATDPVHGTELWALE